MRDLDDLVLEWEDRNRAGEPDCLEELCASFPDQADSLREEVKLLRNVDKLLTVEDSETFPEFDYYDKDIPKRIQGYVIKRVLGRGGMGVVLEGLDTSLDCPVALKTVHEHWPPWFMIDQNQLNRRFAQEGQTLAKLIHPNIVKVRTTATDNGRPYLVMDLLPSSLSAQSEALTRRGTDAVLEFMEKVARAVDHAHNKGVLHRDLKPSNILIDENGEPKVADFGLAKMILPEAQLGNEPGSPRLQAAPTNGHSIYLTSPGQEAGTAPWMAPERLNANRPIEPIRASDVWSLGVILYELLTGKRPYEGRSRQEIAEAISGGPPIPIRELEPHLSTELEAVVQHCLLADPRKRTPDAGTLANELAKLRGASPRSYHREATLVAAAVVITGLMLTIHTAPRDEPLARYESAASGTITRLRNKETVELIHPGVTPAHFLREGAGSTELGPGPNGLAVAAPSFSLLELLPEVPLPRYRVDALIEHTANNSQDFGFLGLYCKAAHTQTPAARYHLFHVVRFNDRRIEPRHVASSMLFCYALYRSFGAGKEPYKVRSLSFDPVKTQQVYAAAKPDEPPAVRALALEVIDNVVVGSWDSRRQDGIKKTFAPLDERARSLFFRNLVRNGPLHAEGIENIDFTCVPTSSSVGILISCGHCLVRSFRISPLPVIKGS